MILLVMLGIGLILGFFFGPKICVYFWGICYIMLAILGIQDYCTNDSPFVFYMLLIVTVGIAVVGSILYIAKLQDETKSNYLG